MSLNARNVVNIRENTYPVFFFVFFVFRGPVYRIDYRTHATADAHFVGKIYNPHVALRSFISRMKYDFGVRCNCHPTSNCYPDEQSHMA